MTNSTRIHLAAALCAVAQCGIFSSPLRADIALAIGQAAGRIDSQTTFGWSFTLSAPLLVTNLGYLDYQSDGLGDAHDIAIWSSAGGAPLVFATVPSGTSATLLNDFRYVSISPIFLGPGTYTIGGYSPGFADSVAIVASNITTAPGITYNGSRSAQGVGLTFPAGDTQGYPNGDFGPNFQFTVPEPAVPAFLALAAILLIIRRRRARTNLR